MALTVQMTDDIRKYETKAIGPFTMRQAICLSLGVLFSLPVGILVDTTIDNKILIMSIIVAPFLASGYIKVDGMRFEILIIRYIYRSVLTPRKRKYKTQNVFREEIARIEEEEYKESLKQMTKKERKKAEKEHDAKTAKTKKITYSTKAKYKVYR